MFVQRGIEHVDLFFNDCTVPPPTIALRFLEIVERTSGVLAACVSVSVSVCLRVNAHTRAHTQRERFALACTRGSDLNPTPTSQNPTPKAYTLQPWQ